MTAATSFRADALEWAERVVEQAEYLAPRYTVVVANPPYMGGKNMDGRTGEFGESAIPDSRPTCSPCSSSDACESRGSRAATSAMITMQSWMFLSVVQELARADRLQQALDSTVIAASRRGHSIIGSDVRSSTTAFVLQTRHAASVADLSYACRRLTSEARSERAATAPGRRPRAIRVSDASRRFAAIPGAADRLLAP